MSVAFRDVEAGLRRACVEVVFGTVVAPLREWSSDMAAPRPLLPETEAMPSVLDVRGLVDPLADSALAEANLDPSESIARVSPTAPQPRRRSWIMARPMTQSLHSATSAGRRTGLACEPAQIASLLAQHDPTSAVQGASPAAPVESEAAGRTPARNVVQLPSRRPGAAASHVETVGTLRTTASTIARWNRLMARSTADRGEVFTGAGVVVERPEWQPRWQPQRLPDEPGMLSGAPLDAAMLARYAFSEAELPRADATLRLRDLTTPEASSRPDIATQPAMIPRADSVDDRPSVAVTEQGSLGRVFASLARIEQQVTARSGHAEPETQWYDDDNGLADRIHDILRRQVERHGINLP